MTLAAGTKLGPYDIVSPLGAGGMGEVYRARDTRLKREVAVKVLPASTADRPDALARFQREAEAVAALSHPNVLAIYDVGAEGGVAYVVMELLEGQTLRARLDRSAIGWSEAVEVATAVADGLAAAHAKGVIHRDIKPENLFLTDDGVVKILDFGLARMNEPNAGQPQAETVTLETRPGAVMGTAHYMSPEQVRGRPADARSDIFSFGCVLHEMVGGRRPFARETAAEVMTAILKEEPPSIVESGTQVPAELDRLIRRCLDKKPERRFQSSGDLAFALRAIRSATPPAPSALPAPAAHRRRPVLWIAAAVVVLTIAAAFYAGSNRPAGRPGAEGPRIESIAVLPFRSIGTTTADGDLFAEGMTDVLISKLGSIRALRTVISHRSVMRYKDADTPLPDIARELNVDALVEGSVQHTGDRVRITVFLFDANNQRLWNDDYEQSTGDVLMLQSQLALAIAAQVHAAISPEEASRLAAARAVEPAAFKAYLLGRRAWNLRTEDGFNQAIAHFNEAVEKDPSYAEAHAGLADSYTLLGAYGFLPPKQAFPIAKAHATQALTIDDTLAEAYTSRALARMIHDWEWRETERDFQRAIELNPGYATAHHWYADLLNALARHTEAIASIKRAQELDPLSPIINADVGLAFFYADQHDQAIEAYRKVLAVNPNFVVAHWRLADAYVEKAMFPEAIAAYQKAVSLSQRHPSSVGRLGYGYAAWGRTDEATRILDELKEQRKRRYVPATRLAQIHAALGETDQAFDWLETAYEERDGLLPWLEVEPAFAPLRSDARFANLLRRMGLDRAAPEARGREPQ